MINVFQLERYGILLDALRVFLRDNMLIRWVGGATNKQVDSPELPFSNIDVLIIHKDIWEECSSFCAKARAAFPSLKIIARSRPTDIRWIDKFQDMGVTGFISDNSGMADIQAAIQSVYENDIYVSPDIQTMQGKIPVFTTRESEVLKLMALGHSSKSIGNLLSIKEKTVETHRKNIISKAGVKNTAALIHFCSVHGLI
jgi:two-component system nitrate/nitrite response regulator NarL